MGLIEGGCKEALGAMKHGNMMKWQNFNSISPVFLNWRKEM